MERDIAVAVTVAILLWKDTTPDVAFPPTKELVKIELGRILGHKNLIRTYPWLRGALGPRLRDQLLAEPWDVHPKRLMCAYVQAIPTEHHKALGLSIRQDTFEDPSFSMLLRRGNPPTASAERLIQTARRVCRVVGLDDQDTESIRDIEESVKNTYFGLYQQMTTRGGA